MKEKFKGKNLFVSETLRMTNYLAKKFDILKLVDEAETIVTALVTLGFGYDYIKQQLSNKYLKQVNGKTI